MVHIVTVVFSLSLFSILEALSSIIIGLIEFLSFLASIFVEKVIINKIIVITHSNKEVGLCP